MQKIGEFFARLFPLFSFHYFPTIFSTFFVFIPGSKSCSFLYPPKDEENDQLPEAVDGQFEGFRRIEHCVRKKLSETLNQDLQGSIVRQSLVAGGLCMALAYINRYLNHREGRKARILVLTASSSSSFHYMNYMNAFFTAQRLGVPIDACILECDSGLLQQGADITGEPFIFCALKF